MQLRGKFGETFVADIIREIRTQNLSGVLRLSQGKILKAVFFENGLPVFAISNLKSEQIGEALVRFQMITPENLADALKAQATRERLGQTLLRLQLLTPEKLENGLRRNMSDIICSVFDWTAGEYTFDERARAEHDVKLTILTADIILEGARRIRDVKFVRHAIYDMDRTVRLTSIDELRNQGIRLQPHEAYVMSRADVPTTIEDLLKICGLPEDKALRAIYGLVAAGMLDIDPLTVARPQQNAAGEPKAAAEQEDDQAARKKIREEVTRTFNFYSTADHFEVLGVVRTADSETIKQAYYKLAKKFHPDRYRHIHDADLTDRLDKILLRLSEAYEAIKDEGGRNVYLRSLGSADVANAEKKEAEKKPEENGSRQERGSEPVSKAPPRTSDADQAQFNFDRALGFLRKGDYMNAVGMLREAVRLAPQSIQFRLQLASTLTQNPRWYSEAEEHFEKIVELDPFNDAYLTKMGVFYQKTNRPDKAREKFEQALQINPASRAALKMLGREEGDENGGKKGFLKSDGGSLFSRLLKRSS